MKQSWNFRSLCLAAIATAFVACNGSSKNSATSPVVSDPAAPDPGAGTGGNGATGGSSGGDPTAGNDPTPSPTPSPSPSPSPAPAAPSHHRCAWLNDDVALGTASLVANADFFDAVHPYFWTLTTSGTLTKTSFTDDATIVSTARAHNMKLMPLVYGGEGTTAIHTVTASASAISAHVDLLVNLAVTHDYDGIELDYEHLWSAGDRASYTALVTQLAAGLHAKGKELSLAVPSIAADNGQNGYDYTALGASGVDVIHLMGYDFHGLGSPHMGPLAPIGWIDAVAARVETLGLGSKFLLGIANYGVGNGWYANSADVIKMCGGSYSSTTDHMKSCSFGTWEAGLAPHCTTSKGDVWFEDGASVAEKARTAKAHGLRGVSYYTLGGEAPGMLDGLRAAYPQ